MKGSSAALHNPLLHYVASWDDLTEDAKAKHLPTALKEAVQAWQQKSVVEAAAILRRGYAMSMDDTYAILLRIGGRLHTTLSHLEIRDAIHQAYYEHTSILCGTKLVQRYVYDGHIPYVISVGAHREWMQKVAAFVDAVTDCRVVLRQNGRKVEWVTVALYGDVTITYRSNEELCQALRSLHPHPHIPLAETAVDDTLRRVLVLLEEKPMRLWDYDPRHPLDDSVADSYFVAEANGKYVPNAEYVIRGLKPLAK